MKKYFQNKNADKSVEIDGFKFNFSKTHWNEATGSYWGIIEITDEVQAQVLEKKGVKKGVYPLTEKEAGTYLEKKTTLNAHKSVQPLNQNIRMNEKNGRVEVVAEEPEETDEEAGAVELSSIMATEPDGSGSEEGAEEGVPEPDAPAPQIKSAPTVSAPEDAPSAQKKAAKKTAKKRPGRPRKAKPSTEE